MNENDLRHCECEAPPPGQYEVMHTMMDGMLRALECKQCGKHTIWFRLADTSKLREAWNAGQIGDDWGAL